MNEKPLFFLLIVSLKASIFSGKDFPMHQLKKNLNRFDLILYMVLFLGVLAPPPFYRVADGSFPKTDRRGCSAPGAIEQPGASRGYCE